jgi:hypothetical protein
MHLSPPQIPHGLPQQLEASNCLSNDTTLSLSCHLLLSLQNDSASEILFMNTSPITKYIRFTVTFQTCNAVLHPSRQYSSVITVKISTLHMRSAYRTNIIYFRY